MPGQENVVKRYQGQRMIINPHANLTPAPKTAWSAKPTYPISLHLQNLLIEARPAHHAAVQIAKPSYSTSLPILYL